MSMRIDFAVAAALVLSVTTLAAQGRLRAIVTVVTDRDAPMRGLGPGDISLRDGGVRHEVIDAQVAVDPVSLAIVVRGFGPGAAATAAAGLRSALADLVRRLPGTQVGVIGTSAVTMLDAAASGLETALAAAATAPRALTDDVREACDALGAAPPDRRVLLLIVDRTTTDPGGIDALARATDALTGARVAVWPIVVGVPAAAASPAASLDRWLDAVTRLSGTLRQSAPALDGLGAAASRDVDLITSQYAVTFAWPDPMLSQFSLITRHDAGVVLAPAWAAK